MASDLISSKKLIDAIKSMRVVFGDEDVFPDHVKNSVILAINLQPAVDAVEVVRCKDCVSCEPIPNTYNSLWCDEWDNCADCDGYCHKGVKKKASDLKPCPLCGGEAMICSTTSFNGEIAYFVRCNGENCAMSGGGRFFKTFSQAVEAWNRRAGDGK